MCFIQLLYGEEVPPQPEPSAIMSFGTSELVTAFKAQRGADGLIGSQPCGAPSGLSPRMKKMNAARFSCNFLI